ncbi:hypothetical protein [Paenibacillus sp. 481]|uniref:hypothetical protein n=1 Tax=Paenibacillus sp. 481 TaxID=2835869 RepID=UPI001E6487BC|nr:hypothetical protein [Paenibacillus sp. 481]UHA75442.1 hypothetical protein KIK04_10820 [Paenibacillus sp. 481]
MTNENLEDDRVIDKEELCSYIVERTELNREQIDIILKHGSDYLNGQEEDEEGVISIDIDEQVSYITRQPDVSLSEEQVELILDLEMDFFLEKGHASARED